MSYTRKSFEELDVLDDFLINAIAADAEVGKAFCRKVLSVLLQREIGKIKVIAQYTLPAPALKYRGIRMDVEIEEFMDDEQAQLSNVYDLEPHLKQDHNLPRHNRFYQAKVDARSMKRGEKDFSNMPNLFIITILNFDPFGYDYMMYTIENHCVEVEELKYEDGLKIIYFYTGGTKGGSQEIQTMLRYLQHSIPDNAIDESTRELHEYVSKVKVMPEVREGYMKFEEFIAYEREEAAKEAAKNADKAATKKTKIQDILELLEEYGETPLHLKEKLEGIDDMEILKKYFKFAVRASSIEEFMGKVSLDIFPNTSYTANENDSQN